jgi:hypothetical protein
MKSNVPCADSVPVLGVPDVLQHVGQQLRATHTRRVAPRRVAPKPVRRLAPHKFQQANIAYVKVSVLHS